MLAIQINERAAAFMRRIRRLCLIALLRVSVVWIDAVVVVAELHWHHFVHRIPINVSLQILFH